MNIVFHNKVWFSMKSFRQEAPVRGFPILRLCTCPVSSENGYRRFHAVCLCHHQLIGGSCGEYPGYGYLMSMSAYGKLVMNTF